MKKLLRIDLTDLPDPFIQQVIIFLVRKKIKFEIIELESI